MKKTKNEADIRKYKECKKSIQKREHQSYLSYINGVIEVGDQEGDPYPRMESFMVNDEGVEKLLRSSNQRKATVPGMIPARLLKEYPKELAQVLAAIFNMTLLPGTALADWKRANVTVVFKKTCKLPSSVTDLFMLHDIREHHCQ